jgi:hypothetical protein
MNYSVFSAFLLLLFISTTTNSFYLTYLLRQQTRKNKYAISKAELDKMMLDYHTWIRKAHNNTINSDK